MALRHSRRSPRPMTPGRAALFYRSEIKIPPHDTEAAQDTLFTKVTASTRPALFLFKANVANEAQARQLAAVPLARGTG